MPTELTRPYTAQTHRDVIYLKGFDLRGWLVAVSLRVSPVCVYRDNATLVDAF